MKLAIHTHIFKLSADGSEVRSRYPETVMEFTSQIVSQIEWFTKVVEYDDNVEMVYLIIEMGEEVRREIHIEYSTRTKKVHALEYDVTNSDED